MFVKYIFLNAWPDVSRTKYDYILVNWSSSLGYDRITKYYVKNLVETKRIQTERKAALKKNKVCIRAKTLLQQAKTMGMENYEICADYFLMSRGAGSDEINTYK